jgi:hypothetical protein
MVATRSPESRRDVRAGTSLEQTGPPLLRIALEGENDVANDRCTSRHAEQLCPIFAKVISPRGR